MHPSSLLPNNFSPVIEICISSPPLIIKNNENFLFLLAFISTSGENFMSSQNKFYFLERRLHAGIISKMSKPRHEQIFPKSPKLELETWKVQIKLSCNRTVQFCVLESDIVFHHNVNLLLLHLQPTHVLTVANNTTFAK